MLAQLEQYATVTADADGAATFTFPPVPQALSWVGNISITGAPMTATFNATVGQTPWGYWQGPFGFGPILCPQNMTLVIAATGLKPGVQYAALWLGQSAPPDELPPTMPAPAAATPFAGNAVPLGTFRVNTNTSQTFDILPADNPLLQSVQAITLQWEPDNPGDAVAVIALMFPDILGFGACAALGDNAVGSLITIPITGRVIASKAGATLQLQASPSSFGPSPIKGNMTVQGSVFSPIMLPPQQLTSPIRTGGTGNIVCPAGATTTVLAAPAAGTYYRVTTLNARTNAAPAAAALMNWFDTINPQTLHQFVCTTANPQADSFALDHRGGAVLLQNNSSAEWRAGVSYEQWLIVGNS